MNKKENKKMKDACPSSKNDEEEAEESELPFDLLTINDHKNSIDLSSVVSCDKDCQSNFDFGSNSLLSVSKKDHHCDKKGKTIQKREKEPSEERKTYLNRKRRITQLQNRVQELEREVHSLRRNQHYCLNCRQRSLDYYRDKITQEIHPELPEEDVAGPMRSTISSDKSLQFEKIDFHVPLMQTHEMEEKMWIFLGTMLIAMGSKVMDFDGTINTFRILKNSVDRVRRQVEKGESFLGMNFFCCKEEMHEPGALIDGMTFDPFYNGKEDTSSGNFTLDGVKIESVEEYELVYDYKYDFNIKYDALLAVMEYARQHVQLS